MPNVVYSCGAMLHGRTLVLPYGCSDSQIRIALVDLDRLLARAGLGDPHERDTETSPPTSVRSPPRPYWRSHGGPRSSSRAGEHGYVGKVISVGAGQALSLQYHREKDETISVLSAELMFEYGPDGDHLDHRAMRPRGTRSISRRPSSTGVTAVTDVVLVEASPAEQGWRRDVVRLSDRYGRTGTSAP